MRSLTLCLRFHIALHINIVFKAQPSSWSKRNAYFDILSQLIIRTAQAICEMFFYSLLKITYQGASSFSLVRCRFGHVTLDDNLFRFDIKSIRHIGGFMFTKCDIFFFTSALITRFELFTYYTSVLVVHYK